jgi:two-component system, chemotaxis family, sensor kinase CheA
VGAGLLPSLGGWEFNAWWGMNMQADDEMIREFLLESRDNLDLLEGELVALEGDPTSEARLASVFRTIHTIKGTAGFLNLRKLESIAHAGESLLARLRDGVILLNAQRISGLLVTVDAVRTLLDQIEAFGAEGPEHYGALIEGLSLLASDESLSQSGELLGIAAPRVAKAQSLIPNRRDGGTRMSIRPPKTQKVPSQQPPREFELSEVEPRQQTTGGARIEEAKQSSDPRIRVDVGLLDRLMNLVGELVLARNQIVQHAALTGEPALLATCQRLNFITSELQEGVMKTRMQPIDNVWSKFPRVVRDLALTCGKQVALEMDGKNTELDKTIIEAISDPLTHIIRNSIDHGIESAEERIALGKPAVASLRLRAFHEGGRVNIETVDDGRGVNVEKVRQRAIEKGLLTPEKARSATQHELVNLIFAPGFSTAEKVTNVSGRGVGMDVVRSNIERIGGTVEVDSKAGLGTSIRIKIPLTLAIIPALVVGAGASAERFAIPQVNLVELVRFDAEQAQKSIERIHGVPVFRLRGSLLALVELSSLLGLGPKPSDEYNILVLQADERQFGLIVDTIFDTEEIVVKPLSRDLKGLNVYAGATIMGDGRVALILDVIGLAERAQLSAAQGRLDTKSMVGQKGHDRTSDTQRLILFRSGSGGRMALPLDAVARLEEFQRADVECVGEEDVIQYRGQILPLVHLSDIFGGGRSHAERLQVVVHNDSTGNVGLVVESIEDIVETEVTELRRGGRRGTSGSMVIQGRVTELLDADAIRETMMRRSA